jgi:hypothetical protein
MRRVLLLLLLAALGAAWYLALPPRAPAQDAAGADARHELRGAIHVHTSRSDGTGTVEDVAAAAARAGLDFVVFTDHGDATREPDPPQYRDGVLCIDAVEISTRDGHLLALGLPQAPYPLGGEARDVVEDVRRLGGLAIAAHPVSNKPELDWRDWNVPLDGLEWLNGDTEWRDESAWSLARALFTYPARRVETLASLLDRPAAALRQWDAVAQQRKIVAVAGADAHARIGLRSLGEPYDSTVSVHLPAYERMFRLFSNVIPETTLGGDPAADAQTVLAAIRAGRVYSRVDAVGGAAAFAFSAATAKMRVGTGEVLPAPGAGALRVEVLGPPESRIDLWKDGAVVATGAGTALEHAAEAPGVYRVEVWRPGAPGEPPIPWIVSNAIYVGREPAPTTPAPARRPASAVMARYTNGPATDWTMETSPASRGALDVVSGVRGTELALRYAIGGAASANPFAAFALAAGPDLVRADRLLFTARADRPMRLSVQLREPAGEADHRWQRSVYLDTAPREVIVYFDDLRPVGTTPRDLPTLANVDSILFVIDMVNTPLGGNGRLWIDDVRYAR